jgi:hypothetical protein
MDAPPDGQAEDHRGRPGAAIPAAPGGPTIKLARGCQASQLNLFARPRKVGATVRSRDESKIFFSNGRWFLPHPRQIPAAGSARLT